MKTQAALATIMIAAAIGVSPANAAERMANLMTPAAPDAVREHTGIVKEARLSVPSRKAVGWSELERQQIETVVRGQIHALSKRKADQAYALLAPIAQRFFIDAPTFLSTLNQQMIPVMYAKEFVMTGLDREADDAIQHVVFTGPKNHEWLARFKVERQPDGAWLVKGCQVELAHGQLT